MKIKVDDIKARILETVPSAVIKFFYLRPVSIIRLFTRFDSQCAHESYYPDQKRKNVAKIFAEQLHYIIIYGEPNYTYFSYGFDVKSRSERKQYLNMLRFNKSRLHSFTDKSENIVLQNKLLFNALAEYMGVATACNLGVIHNNKVLDLKSKQLLPAIDFIRAQGNCDLFIKPIDGSFGINTIHFISNCGDYIANDKPTTLEILAERLKSGRFLIQQTVKQHPELAKFHPQSVNTLRLITIRNQNTGGIRVFPSIARFGVGDSFIDNTANGGLAVGINHDTGTLKEYGFFRAEFGTKVRHHPDSGISFSDFQIPFFKECVEQAILLHSALPGLTSVGWDIAIGEEGPIFIEGNDKWDIRGPQICHGPLKCHFNLMLGTAP